MSDPQEPLRLFRVLGAPPDAVWAAWTDPKALAAWWWPARFQTTYQVELRVGGAYAFRSADLPAIGVLALAGVYREVSPARRLAYSWCWEGRDGPSTEVTVDFVNRGGRTEVQIAQHGLPTPEERENHRVGWTDCLDRLDALLERLEADTFTLEELLAGVNDLNVHAEVATGSANGSEAW